MKNDIKKKTDNLMGLAKETMGIGVTLGVGHTVMGYMGGIAPPQASGAIRATGTGLNLIGIGQMAKIGMALPRALEVESKKKKIGNKYLDRII